MIQPRSGESMQPTAQAVAGAEEAPPRLWKGMASAMPLRPRRKRRRRNDHKRKQILSPLAKRRRPRHPQRCHPEAHALRGPKDLCNFLRRDTKWKDGLTLFLLPAGCPISRVLCEKWDAANMTPRIKKTQHTMAAQRTIPAKIRGRAWLQPRRQDHAANPGDATTTNANKSCRP